VLAKGRDQQKGSEGKAIFFSVDFVNLLSLHGNMQLEFPMVMEIFSRSASVRITAKLLQITVLHAQKRKVASLPLSVQNPHRPASFFLLSYHISPLLSSRKMS
jgi:hypothetical protein